MFIWQVNKRPPDSVLVATLWPREGASRDWCAMWKNLRLPEPNKWITSSGLPFGEGRTQFGYMMLNEGFQWLFMLDSDVLVPPDTVLRFVEKRVPIMSALYPQRYPTFDGMQAVYKPCLFSEGVDPQGNMQLVPITNFQYGQIIEAAYAPGGAMLIHRSVFETMLQAGIKDFFEWTMRPITNPNGRSEDFDFCLKARRLGFKVLVDSGVQAAHEVMCHVSVGTGLVPRP